MAWAILNLPVDGDYVRFSTL